MPTPMSSVLRGRFSETPGKSSATRAGSSMAKLSGSSTGPDMSSTTCTRSPGSVEKLILSNVVPDCAWAAHAHASAAKPIAVRINASRPVRIAVCKVVLATSPKNHSVSFIIAGFRIRLFGKCDLGTSFLPAATAIRDYLEDLYLILGYVGYLAVILAHVVAYLNSVDDGVRIANDAPELLTLFQGSHHAKTVERIALELLAITVEVGRNSVVGDGALTTRRIGCRAGVRRLEEKRLERICARD